MFNSPANAASSSEFPQWHDTDFNNFLSDLSMGNSGFLSGQSPSAAGLINNQFNNSNTNANASSSNDTPGSSSQKFYPGAESQTSPPSSIRSPAELLYYQQNMGAGNNGTMQPQLGLQIPPRFQAAIAAAQLKNQTLGNNGLQSFPVNFANSSPADQLNLDLANKSAPKGKKKDPSTVRPKVRPCDHCRRRKTKCTMNPESNVCQRCEEKGLKCSFNDTKRPADESSEVVTKKGKYIVDELHPPPTIPIREVDPVQDYSSMPGYSLLKKTLSLQYPRSSFYVGPSSIYDPLLLNRIQLNKIDQVQLNQTTSLRKVAPNVQFTLKDDYTEQLYETTERNVDAVERFVAPHGKILIELYFRIVHPSFPVLHKKVFLEKYSRTHREFSAPLLAAVYALAIQWWDYDPQLSQFPKPNVVALLKLAMQTFAFVIERPKLSAVQAGLLLLQCRSENTRNWSLCSQVVALSEELGLGLDCADWRLPKWERGLRRRLAWAVYLQDKWLSLIESRPSHIIENRNWSVKEVTDEDFPEKANEPDSSKEGSTDIDNGKLLFKEMISLSQILSEILDSLFSMSAMENLTRIDQVLKAAKPLQLKLRQWYHSLPPQLHIDSIQPRKLNSNGYLQLAYFAAEITLHRKIITTLTLDSPYELIQVCRTAARTRLLAAIDFVRALKLEHIHSFWHSSATANFTLIGTFAAILYVTAPTTEEANLYKDQVYNYRWVLRVSAKGFDQAGAALEQLDTILFHIPGLFKDTHELNNNTTPAPSNDENREYSETPPLQYPEPSQPTRSQPPPPKIHQSFSTSNLNSSTHSRSNSVASQSKQSPLITGQMQPPFSHTQQILSKPNTPSGNTPPVIQPSPVESTHSSHSQALSPQQLLQRSQYQQLKSNQTSPKLFKKDEDGNSPSHSKRNSTSVPGVPSPLENSTTASSLFARDDNDTTH